MKERGEYKKKERELEEKKHLLGHLVYPALLKCFLSGITVGLLME